jgi:ABC-type branched-subunit amino acid transport system substrate-binding protein
MLISAFDMSGMFASFGLAMAVVIAAPGCGGGAMDDDPIQIGLLLSYTGSLASTAGNSERALGMAIEAANVAGGVGGRRLRVVAQDTRSDTAKLKAAATDSLISDSAVLIGPDYADFLTHLRPILGERTILLPSFATASDGWDRPASWFSMGPGIPRIACELMAQAAADGRHSAIHIVSPGSYNGTLSYDLSNQHGVPKHVLSKDQASSTTLLRPLTRALLNADAYLLLASPEVAASLVHALTALGALAVPDRWYLSPSLHTPEFLEAIPKGALRGARGVSSGTVAGAAGFRDAFTRRWQEPALDDAYSFYDAGAVAALALQRALQESPILPTGAGLAQHVLAVTGAGGAVIQWNEIGRGLDLLARGEPVQYVGLTGQLQFDARGRLHTASTNWWSIGDDGFFDTPRTPTCQ